jgi:hypothetical protein
MQIRLSLAAPALLALTLAGCGGGAGPGPAAGEPLPPRSIDPAGLNPVQSAIAHLEALSSYHATVATETEGGDRIDGSYDFVAPDRYHLKVGASIPIEVITIGHDWYVKTAGKWQKADPTFLPFSAQDLIAQLEEIAGAADWRPTEGGPGCSTYARDDDRICIRPDGPPASVVLRDGATRVRIDFSNFDARLEIKAPI